MAAFSASPVVAGPEPCGCGLAFRREPRHGPAQSAIRRTVRSPCGTILPGARQVRQPAHALPVRLRGGYAGQSGPAAGQKRHPKLRLLARRGRI